MTECTPQPPYSFILFLTSSTPGRENKSVHFTELCPLPPPVQSTPGYLRRVVLPASFQLLLPVDPGLVLGVHVVLVDGVLVGEGALHLADVVVDLLAAVLVDGAADGPDHAVLEPELHHAGEVVSVRGVHLQRTKQDRLT